MSDIILSDLDDVQTKYQPRLLMRPEDPVNSEWETAVCGDLNLLEEEDLFDTAESAYQAGLECIHECSEDPEAFRKNLKRFKIVCITWGYVPFPVVTSERKELP